MHCVVAILILISIECGGIESNHRIINNRRENNKNLALRDALTQSRARSLAHSVTQSLG